MRSPGPTAGSTWRRHRRTAVDNEAELRRKQRRAALRKRGRASARSTRKVLATEEKWRRACRLPRRSTASSLGPHASRTPFALMNEGGILVSSWRAQPASSCRGRGAGSLRWMRTMGRGSMRDIKAAQDRASWPR